MKTQIVHISPHQFGKIGALTIGLLLSPALPIGFIILLVGGNQRFNGLIFLAAPLLYALGWYLWIAILSALYNVVAQRFGGVEITLSEPE